MAVVGTRPNIRIEIQNNLVEPMQVDDDEKPADSDFEDGEISDKNESSSEIKPVPKLTNRTWTNTDGGFTTGVDIFDKKEQEKLQERAHRFGLRQDEINNFTDEQLQKLHVSLGITVENEKTIRFEAIHMRGTDEMSTEDVFEYFGKYGPAYIEWINDESCNVVWQDKVSAARALHFISRPVRGMPVEGPCDPFTKEVTPENDSDKGSENADSQTGRSILLVNKDREVQLEKEDTDMATSTDKEDDSDEYVSISTITVPIPPGYWRLGLEHPKTRCILLRFAVKTDKKPLRAERFSEYYKKYGNPNFGGLKGLISESRRKKFKGIFDRNKDISKKPEDSKNPWGDLAENWNEDEQFAEKIYQPQNDQPKREVTGVEKSDVLKRLGAKRAHESDSDSTENQESTRKKSKVPRMRMYADEEEAKIKRKKQLLQVKLKKNPQDDPNKMQDLRNIIIGTTTKKTDRSEQREPPIDNNDLGTKLKNRARKEEESKRNIAKSVSRSARSDLRTEHGNDDRRRRSPVPEDRPSWRRKESPTRRRRNEQHDRPHYKSRLHSDRHEHRRPNYSDEDDDGNHHKPRSKVAVVIKTQKRPTVASTVWSRINLKKERLKTASERLQSRKESSSSSESSSESNSSSSSSESSSDSSSESDDDTNEEEQVQEPPRLIVPKVERPGFTNAVQSAVDVARRKSPLRIEISNDHFKEE